jgi:hypothetical protein
MHAYLTGSARALVRRLHPLAVVTTRPWLPALATCLAALAAGAAGAQVAAPVLKWAHGGCFASWCETGWYASPAVADLDGDGAPEVVASASSIVALDGATGALQWRVASGHDRSEPGASNVGRTWPGIAVADIDGDGALEIATAHGGGWTSVYDADGFFEPGWPRRPVAAELRGLAVADIDGDGPMKLVVSAARSDPERLSRLGARWRARAGWARADRRPTARAPPCWWPANPVDQRLSASAPGSRAAALTADARENEPRRSAPVL